MVKTKNNGIVDIKIFFVRLLLRYPSDVSDKIIIAKPNKKITYLFLLYFRFSFEVKIKNNETKINIGIYKGLINLLNNSLYMLLGSSL